ncbi:hypothetical protein WN48_07229 [Eufriesea mexicana]|uniref:Uncharacterized protein n=1 Tax=Eufriesea mexicana TaxID=516756 RepID=A0A310SNU0_9HYME|nr:PREDICTED: uncharacterized protein LOC108555481 [Eufriesea mexicana]XP_017766637.1 PREDICTED: uncharacterized protein LOC108555481 [Eufriesea mexicana]OAD62772.1 hypothetical protein WN48_07229 [Eufriesea mexicana]
MAQGKLKVKSKVPSPIKNKNKGKNKKSLAIQRRSNAPIQPKKRKFEEAHKLKQMITRTVNKAMEDELRKKALDGKKSLKKVQLATKNNS